MNNAKFFTVLLLVVSTTFAAQAQVSHKLGFTFGGNQSSLSSDLFNTASGRLGLTAGCNFVVAFNDRFELSQDIAFVQKGASAQTVHFLPEQKPEQGSYDYTYNAFEVTGMAAYQIAPRVPIRIQAGAFFGSHFHNMDKGDREQFLGDYEELNNAIPAYKLIDAYSGLDFGPAIGISGGNNHFRATARYYYGARNLYKNLDFVEGGHHINSSSLRFTLTYFL